MTETSPSKEGAPAECPVCYEKFHPLEHTHRQLSCGHAFCHDCLVKCLLSAKLDGHIQNSIICPVCRYVTFLSKKKALWLSNPRTLEVPLSPSSLSQLTKLESSNALVMPLVDTDCSSLRRESQAETRSTMSSSSALGLQCCQSPIALAVLLILTVALLAAVLPWLLLVKKDSQ